MRIGFFTGSTSHGGIGRVCASMSCIWSNAGHDVLLFSEDEPRNDEYLFAYSHREVVKQGQIKEDELRELHDRTRFDVAVINGRVIGRGFEGVLRTLKSIGVPVVSIIHHSFSTWLYFLIGNNEHLAKPYLPSLDCLVCVDPLQTIWWRMMGAQALYIPNPVKINGAGCLGGSKPSKHLIWSGRATDWGKRLDLMMEMFSKILLVHHDAELTILGDAPLFVQKRYKKAYGTALASRVNYAGFVPNVREYLCKADIHVFTSILEVTVPQVILEAQTIGLPSVVMDMPCFCDIGETDGVIKCQDEKAFIDAVVDLLNDKTRMCELGQAALRAGALRNSSQETERKWSELLAVISDKPSLNDYIDAEYRKIDMPRHRDALIMEVQRAFAYFCDHHFRKIRMPKSLRCRVSSFIRRYLGGTIIFKGFYKWRDERKRQL